MAYNSGRPSPLYSAFPLFITHQPTPPHPHPLNPPVPCPGEQGLIWRVHNNSCNSPTLAGPPRAQAWPKGSMSGSHVFGWRDRNPQPLSRLCGAITVSLASLFISRQPASPNPTPISDSCAHIPAGLHARAVKWDTGEGRREERSPVWSWPSL